MCWFKKGIAQRSLFIMGEFVWKIVKESRCFLHNYLLFSAHLFITFKSDKEDRMNYNGIQRRSLMCQKPMKFTLYQMELERKMLRKDKNERQSFLNKLFKTLGGGTKSNVLVKGEGKVK